MSTMDNASAQLAIALQLHDLDELEVSGTADKLVIRLQRQQLEIDSGFDAVTFEASRRLALSMAKAVEDDSALLARSTPLPQIDDTTFDRLALLNHAPPTVSNQSKLAPAKSANQTLPSKATSQKRARVTNTRGRVFIGIGQPKRRRASLFFSRSIRACGPSSQEGQGPADHQWRSPEDSGRG